MAQQIDIDTDGRQPGDKRVQCNWLARLQYGFMIEVVYHMVRLQVGRTWIASAMVVMVGAQDFGEILAAAITKQNYRWKDADCRIRMSRQRNLN